MNALPDRGPSGPRAPFPPLDQSAPDGARSRRATIVAFALLLLAAAFAPLARPAPEAHAPARDFPGWPSTFEGRTLTPVPLTAIDSYFTRGFPGRIARFADGDRHVVLRWVSASTRRLHPASLCFKGAGYAIEPRPMRRTSDGALMGCFAARKGEAALRVCEFVRAADGQSWSDISSWHWSALFAPPGTQWWSLVVVEREKMNRRERMP